jgi:hypothetical protein
MAPRRRASGATGSTAGAGALFNSITASAGIAGALLGGTVVFALGETWVFAIDAFAYLPQIAALALLPTIAALPHRAVVWAVGILRRRFACSRILFAGFLGAGLLLIAHATLAGWRSPGLDAVTASMTTLLPLGLAVSLNASLLQALVVLACPDEERRAGVLAVYGTIAAVLMPLGGIILGVAADLASPWAAAFASGSMMTALALALRRRLWAFDALGSQADDQRLSRSMGGHWHTHHRYIAGADFALFTRAHPRSLG